ncbi:histidinol-phosphatase [Haloglycomyces albus]|uniref:histidinol-phosphatase n=1 Tax=Haloglycomyces albus TaxID=526067 RepID=UPI00046D2E42|nr:histidinol-phosphatase [Haloglycomyces albus]
MTDSSYNDDLRLALSMADAADRIGMERFRSNELKIDQKPDMTHVTEADLAVERTIRDTLAVKRPDDGVYGEEFGDAPGESGRRWVLDPIDGTANYVRGNPVWGSLIALFDGDEPVVGVASAPALGRRWWAAQGAGAWAGPTAGHGGAVERLEVSQVKELSDSFVSISSLSSWKRYDKVDAIVELLDDAWRERAYGDFYHYALVAEGSVDVACEPSVELWDLAPMAVIVEEAGGRFTDLKGNRGPAGGTSLATNGRLHDDILRRVGL